MAKKSFKKFAGTGKLKAVINSRREHQKSRKLIEGRQKRKAGAKGVNGGKGDDEDDEGEGEDGEEEESHGKKAKGPKNVDDLMGASFMEDSEDDLPAPAGQGDDDDEGDDAELDDTDDDFASIDDMDEMEQSHLQALSTLAETDPEFYKYLQENDKDLLNFGQDGSDDEDDAASSVASDINAPPPQHESLKAKKSAKKLAAASKSTEGEDDDSEFEGFEGGETDDEDDEGGDMMGGEDSEDEDAKRGKGKKGKGKDAKNATTVLTMEMLRGWQKGMLEKRSLKSLRRLLLAFRAAAHSNEDGEDSKAQTFAYDIEDPKVFNKLILTTLKYTPLLLTTHIPYRLSPTTGRYKLLKSPPPALMKMLLSYVANLLHLISQLPDDGGASGLLRVCLTESAKMVPWIGGAKKTVRMYLKTLLELWSSGSDGTRIACFLAIRKLVSAGDEGVKDMVLKGIYLSLLRTCKATSIHTLPSINLMKNSASEIYCLDHSAAYQHAFGYIRQLAVHLRNSMRVKTKDSYKAVYNWQFAHCIDFWSLVLSTACSRETRIQRGGVESELQPLIYPLVQVTLGVIRLIPTSRYFPLRFHLLRSLLRLSTHTNTYIPLTPSLLEPLSSAEFTHKPKPSTLTPLDFEYHIRAPSAYPRTRVYQDGLGEEIAYLLLESQALMSTSIAFPELAIPVITALKRFVKKGKNGKVGGMFKVLIERMEGNSKWIGEKRKGVEFAPNDRGAVEGFLEGVEVETSPLGTYWKLQKRVRETKRREVEKAAREERGPEEDGSEGEGEDEEEEEEESEAEMEMEDDE